MLKRMISVLLATLMMLAIGTTGLVAASAEATDALPEKESGTDRYFFYLPEEWENEYSTTAGIYWWEGTDWQNSWPGIAMNKADAEALYYYDVPEDVTTVVFNNYLAGGSDPEQDIYFADCGTISVGTEYYDSGESKLYPEGNDGFDNMVYVIDPSLTYYSSVGKASYEGEWYYYYGGGEYGITPEKSDAPEVYTSRTLVIPKAEETEPVTTAPAETTETTAAQTTAPAPTLCNIYFTNSENWADVYLYVWKDGENGQWPGEKMTYVFTTEYGEDVYGARVYSDTNILFHSGYGEQTIDLYPIDNNGYYLMEKMADGRWGVYAYEPADPMPSIPEATVPDTTPTETTSTETTVPEETSAPVDDVERNRYYFYLPEEWENEYSTTAGIYWWEGTDSHSAWPGVAMNKTDIEGLYYYDVPTDVTTVNFNNFVDGGMDPEQPVYKAVFETTNIGTEYYDAGESELYPDGTLSFDNMVYVVDPTLISQNAYNGHITYEGEWYYYYGDGEYGYAPDKASAPQVYNTRTLVIPEYEEILPVETTATEPAATETTAAQADTAKVYFTNTENWSKVNIYVWNDGETPQWPGEAMTFLHTDEFGRNVYGAEVTDGANIIINSFDAGSGEQTIDLIAFDGKGYYLREKNSEGKWTVGMYDYLAPEETTATDTTATETTPTETTATQPETTPTLPDKVEGKNRYFFYLPEFWENEYSSTAGIYWWTGSESHNSWPGIAMNKADAQGLYYCDVPDDVDFVIFNNFVDGGMDPEQPVYNASFQTKNVGTEYYEVGENDLYPDGTDSFDDMVFVIDVTMNSTSAVGAKLSYEGEWYYYYGGGEYGITPEKSDAPKVYTSRTLVVPQLPEPTEPAVITDDKSGISVEGMADATLVVEELTSDKDIADIDLILVGEKVGKIYDITLSRDGDEVQPDGTVTVKIPAADTGSKVYRVEADGTLTDMNAVLEDGFLVFTTEHFSLYVVTESVVYELGDVNKDEKINVKDATAIQKHVAELVMLDDEAQALADYDDDTRITVKDATKIQKFVAGLIE